LNEVWATKHRPSTLTEIIGQHAIVSELMSVVADEAPMQHYLFHSAEPGTGKTSMVYALAYDLGWDVLTFNASTKKQRGIEFVEEQILPLTRSGINERIFLLDEADQLTDAAQSALKGVIENASGYFILTCNNLAKVSPWLQSRCQVRDFAPIEPKAMERRLINILAREGRANNLSQHELKVIVRRHSGDLRNAIGALQTAVHLVDSNRANFIDSLTVEGIDYARFLRLCFRDKSFYDAHDMFVGPLRQQIRAVFQFAMQGNAAPDSKMVVIEAAVTSERDILNGVDEDIVRANFVRMLINNVYMGSEMTGKQ
jgi:DNA polymerase III delta prime subunit